MAGEAAGRQEKGRGRKMTSIDETPGHGNDVVYVQDYTGSQAVIYRLTTDANVRSWLKAAVFRPYD
jgi:hypothetical protein